MPVDEAPIRGIEVSIEQRRNEGAGKTGDHRENPPTNGTARHDSRLRRSGVTRPGIEPGSPWWEASGLTANHPADKGPSEPPCRPLGPSVSSERFECQLLQIITSTCAVAGGDALLASPRTLRTERRTLQTCSGVW
ncbi:hypothetical protein PR048_033492 [Dryococelus australis]|uniref:Uncharacterized protein n=1 Tax=Dryococelus australis TaxID=614101 RepID=A0ABQ9G1C5_9NEOP|nr:hypothetical protein PR048_033492 [Dryococelus australis]